MTQAAVVVEVLGSHAHAKRCERVALGEDNCFTIGRSPRADLVLDDPHVAPLHATVEIAPQGVLRVTDLGTLNGVIVGRKRLRGVQRLELPGGELRIGRTALRIRTAGDALAPERRDNASPGATRAPVWTALACALLSIASVAYLRWLGAPRDLVSVAVSALRWTLVSAGVWIGAWALLSRILLGEWRWIRHAAILFGATVALFLIDNALDLAWFAFTLPHCEWRGTVPGTALVVAMLYAHLRYATNLRRLHAASVAVLLPAIVIGTGMWLQLRAQHRNVNYIASGERFFPPALRLVEAAPAADYFRQLHELQAEADRKRRALPAFDHGEDEKEDEIVPDRLQPGAPDAGALLPTGDRIPEEHR